MRYDYKCDKCGYEIEVEHAMNYGDAIICKVETDGKRCGGIMSKVFRVPPMLTPQSVPSRRRNGYI